MRYEDASHTGAFQGSEPEARNDADAIPAGSHVPATGNVITGEGTQTGPSGSDAAAGAHITSIAGAGGEDSSFAGGKLAVSGEFGRLSIDAEGNYSYQAKEGTPENSRDRFTYTLADSQGNADTATLTIEIGKTPAVIKANAQQVVPGPDGVVVLPAGVELSDIHIVGRNLVIDLPDGGQMVIIDGAVFVPQLVLGGVEVPATNLAALLIGQEIAPAEGGPVQSSGGNFEVPLSPLDPGVPLGDLIPPTEYGYQPPEVKEIFDFVDEEPEIFVQPDGQPASVAAVDSVDERGLPERGDFEPAGTGEIGDGNGTNDSDHSEFTTGTIVYDSPDGVDSITISVAGNELVITNGSVGDTINGEWGQLTITSVAPGVIGYEYRLADNTPGNDTHDDFLVTLVDSDGDVATATLRIDIIDDVPTARPDTDFIAAGDLGPVTGNVITDDDAGDHDNSGTDSDTDNGADTVGADDASLTNVTGAGSTQTTEGGWIVQGQYGVLTINDDGSYSYLRNADTPGGVSDVFTYTLTDGDGDVASSTLTITIEDATPSLATPATAQLDDDVFTGGNPGGTDDANPDTANLSGNLGGSGGDGDLDYAFTGTNTLPAGFSVDPSSTATELKIAQNGNVVLTITLNTETGAYTVTQNAPIDHPTPGVSEEDLTFGIGVKTVDADGDSAVNTLTIKVDDDTPLANNDSDTVSGSSATGNVITGSGTTEGTGNADKPGADGFDSITKLQGSGGTDTDPTGGFTVNGTYGSLQMAADGTYTYTRTDGLGGGQSEVFTYTYKDGDGDLASATLTINIPDAVPSLGTPAIAQLDDETFTGGNPGGTDDANPNTANLSGSLAGSGGDGDLDYAFTGTNTLPAGFSVDPSSTATTLKIAQAGVGVVLTITLDLETGAYTVVQNQPMDHPTAGVSEEDLTFGIGVKTTDVDGDSAINTLTIKVDDDTPLAFNDTDTIAGGGTTATGNVITGSGTVEGTGNADKPGADGYDSITGVSGAVTSDTNPTGGFTAQGTYGTLQMAADGTYTYTRADGSPGDVSDVFTYTYKDGDGDPASATLTITIGDAAPSLPAPAIAQLDDETFTGGNPGGTDDANPNTANLSGSLAGSGGDGDLDYAFTGTNTLPAGFSVDASSTPTSLKIAQAGVGIVMTITLDLETGAYTVTQNQPMDHPTAGVSEEDLTFGIGVKTVDEDGDSAVSTLTIKVDDDTPLANNDSDTVSGSSATGNVITGSGTTEGTGNADKPGADGFDSITKLQGSGGTDTDPTGGFTVNGTYGSLQMAADGTYTYTRTDGLGGGQSEVFTYTYKDGDGDLASATLTINIPDATPLLGTPAIAQSDDEIFANGIAGGTGDADPNTANLSGNLAGSGGDGDLDYAFTGTNTLPAGFSVDASSTPTSLKIAQAGVGIVMTITLDLETGAYTVTQNQPIDHPTPGTTEEDVQFLIGVKVVDVDGDSATNTLTINVDDDTPTAVHAAGITSGLQNGGGDSASANLDGGAGGNSILVDNFGADGGKVIFTAASQTYLEGLHLKHAGVELTYVISNGGQTITGSAGGTTVITIELQPGGSNNYTVTMNDSIDTLVTTVFDDLNFDFVGGNGSWAGFTSGTNGDGINDLLLTPMVNGSNSSTMNTNANEGGVGSGNSVSLGEGVRIDSVSDLQASPAPTPSGDYGTLANQNHVFGQHENVIGLSGLISTVNGAPGSTTEVQLTARDESGASDTNDLVGDGTIEPITVVTISHGGFTGTVLRSGGASQDVLVDGITYHVTFQTNTATVTGVVEDTRIGAQTADGYDSLEFRNVGGQEFKIGAFAALDTSAGPVDLAVPISVVDGDGDTVSSGTLPIHIDGSDEAPLLAQQSSFAAPADDTSSFSSLLASDSQDQQLQKTAANSNTTLLAAAVAASGLAGTQAAASPGNSDFGHQMAGDNSNFASKLASFAVDSGDEGRSMLSSETKVAANDEVQTLSSSQAHAESAQSAHGLDNAAAHMPAELSAFFAAGDQGPAANAAAAGPVAPAVAMVSAEALQAAGLDGTAKHGGEVDKVVADALGHAAPPTVDGLLQALGGQGSELAAISHVASPAADTVPAWDMGGHGAFVPGADMMFKMGAEMLHHDAVQPVVNG